MCSYSLLRVAELLLMVSLQFSVENPLPSFLACAFFNAPFHRLNLKNVFTSWFKKKKDPALSNTQLTL